jgi:hypothetical protein
LKKKTEGYQPESSGLTGAVPPHTGSHVRADIPLGSVVLKAEAENWCPFSEGPLVSHCVHDKEDCRDCPTFKGVVKKFQEATAIELKLPKDILFPETDIFERPARDDDVIGHPNHYCEGRKYEPKDVIRDWGLNFNLGNAVKYISRNGRKDGNSALQDLKKARQYLDFEIDFLEKEGK